MRRSGLGRLLGYGAALLFALSVRPQQLFDLNPTCRTQIDTCHVNPILPMAMWWHPTPMKVLGDCTIKPARLLDPTGPAAADEASYTGGVGKRELDLNLHMDRNRVVRRMFEALGYVVLKPDRVVFAGLTKKDLPRGKWRHLSEKDVLWLTRRKLGC